MLRGPGLAALDDLIGLWGDPQPGGHLALGEAPLPAKRLEAFLQSVQVAQVAVGHGIILFKWGGK